MPAIPLVGLLYHHPGNRVTATERGWRAGRTEPVTPKGPPPGAAIGSNCRASTYRNRARKRGLQVCAGT